MFVLALLRRDVRQGGDRPEVRNEIHEKMSASSRRHAHSTDHCVNVSYDTVVAILAKLRCDVRQLVRFLRRNLMCVQLIGPNASRHSFVSVGKSVEIRECGKHDGSNDSVKSRNALGYGKEGSAKLHCGEGLSTCVGKHCVAQLLHDKSLDALVLAFLAIKFGMAQSHALVFPNNPDDLA